MWNAAWSTIPARLVDYGRRTGLLIFGSHCVFFVCIPSTRVKLRVTATTAKFKHICVPKKWIPVTFCFAGFTLSHISLFSFCFVSRWDHFFKLWLGFMDRITVFTWYTWGFGFHFWECMFFVSPSRLVLLRFFTLLKSVLLFMSVSNFTLVFSGLRCMSLL